MAAHRTAFLSKYCTFLGWDLLEMVRSPIHVPMKTTVVGY